MSEKNIWYCSIAKGVPYTAIRFDNAVYPRAEWGKNQALKHASCSIRADKEPTYERFCIEFEDATGYKLPEKKPPTD